MAAYTTYEQIGQKEDISDIIENITPYDTPFQSAIKKEDVDARLHQWQEDSLSAVNTANARVEGADATDATLSPTVMRSNNTQILSKTFGISGTADEVSTYGRDKETALQKAKASKELKRDLEYMFVGRAQAATIATNATARLMASAFSLIGAGTTVAAGTNPLTETHIVSANELLYNEGGEADIIMVKPADAKIIAGFAGTASRVREISGDSKKIVNAVDVYVSPYGQQKVVLNRFIFTQRALLFKGSNWRKLVLRDWFSAPLAKQGDSQRHMILGEFSLKHNNFLSSAQITGLT